MGPDLPRLGATRRRGVRVKLIVGLLAAGFALPSAANDLATVLADMKRLSARVEALEQQNRELEKALASERISEKDPELATRVKYVESQLDAVKGPAAKLTEALDGIHVWGSITTVTQRVGAGGTAGDTDETRGNYRGDLTVSLPLGSMGDSEGKLFTHFRLGQGAGIGLRPTYTSTANTTAFETNAGPDDSFAILAQAWYQFKVPLFHDGSKANARDHLSVTVGKIDSFVFFDQNAIADDESTRFLNNVFVHNPLLDSGGDTGADAYGFQPGAIVKYANSRQEGAEWGMSLGVFASSTGANFSGSCADPFVIAQIETAARLNFLPGNYRAYAWSNGRAQNYDAVQRRNTGVGFSVDQKVTDDLTLFSRFGYHSSGKVPFDRALTLGAELEGTGWGRSADSVGIAHGSLRTSKDYRDDSPAVAGYQASGYERQTEIYYRYKLNNAIALSPDFQWIRRPSSDDSASTIKVASLRARIGF